MLTWFASLAAPKLSDPLAAEWPELVDPSGIPDLAGRGAAVIEEALATRFPKAGTPGGSLDGFRLIWGMGARDLIRSEADQNPELAGRTPTFADYPAFQPVELPIGDDVVLTGRRSTGAPGAPIVMVVHGMFDSHTARYVVELSEGLRRWGFHVLALDMRGHGQRLGVGPPPSMGLYEGRDLLAAAKMLTRQESVSVGILGLSYGGQCAVRAAHEATLAGEEEVLRGGVLSVGAPLNTTRAVGHLDDPSELPRGSSFLQRRIAGQISAVVRRQLRLRGRQQSSNPTASESFAGYIREVVLPAYPDTPPLVGSFLGEARSTQPGVLDKLAVPTLLVHSADDPLVSISHLDDATELARDNPLVGTLRLSGGGHCGLLYADLEGTTELLSTWFGRLRDG